MIRVSVAPSSSSWRAHLVGEHAEVAGVDPHRAQLGAGDLDAEPDGLGDVVGVDQQGRAACRATATWARKASASVSCSRVKECALVPVVGTPYSLAGPEVGARGEAGDVRRPGAGDRGPLVGTPRAHLDAGPLTGRPGHPRGGRGDRRVVVVDREQHGLEQHRLGEGRLDHQQRGVGEVGLALGVAPDVAAEAVVGEPLQRRLVDDRLLAQERRSPSSAKRNASIASSARPDPGDHAVATPGGQPAGEQLEDRAAVGGAEPIAAWSIVSS